MAKNRKNEEVDQAEMEETVQNAPPKRALPTFDHFWSSCVKGGTPLLKDSFRAHLKALGWADKPERWIEAAKHFGISTEK